MNWTRSGFMPVAYAGLLWALLACSSPEGDAPAASGGGAGSPGVGGSSSGVGGSESGLGGSSSGVGGSSGSTGGSSSGVGGASPTITTGVPGDTVLTDLDAQQLQQVCDTLSQEYLPAVANPVCRLAAVMTASTVALGGGATDADVQAACSDYLGPCVADIATGEDAQCEPITGECTTTVAEFEACMNDQVAAYAALEAQLPACETLTVASVTALQSSLVAPEEPQSCVTAEANCPGLSAD